MKETRWVISARLLQQPHLFGEKIMISDAAWAFQHDLETKHQDGPWKSLDPKPR
jgi:hypothetical protein